MSWADAIRRWWAGRRWWNTPEYRGVLRVVDDALEAFRGEEIRFRIRRDEIVAVELFKRDMITVDDVCCDIQVEGGGWVRIDEELPGWKEAIAWLESLPGFRTNWHRDVIWPPMAECRQRVFERRS